MSPEEVVQEEMRRSLKQSCLKLLNTGIQLLAIDFDMTVCSIHTYGEFVPSEALRPIFVALLQEAQKIGLKACIATFHCQEDNIERVLTEQAKLQEPIVVRGMNVKETPGFPDMGKSQQILSAWNSIFPDEEIKWEKILLIDDDINNVVTLKELKGFGIPFLPQEETVFFLEQLAQFNAGVPLNIESKLDNITKNTACCFGFF